MAEPISRIGEEQPSEKGAGAAQEVAVAEAMALLEALSETGLLEGARALVTQSGALAELLFKEAESAGAADLLQNLLIVSAALKNVEPEQLKAALNDLSAMGRAMAGAFSSESGGALTLVRLLRQREVRRALASFGTLMSGLGGGPQGGRA